MSIAMIFTFTSVVGCAIVTSTLPPPPTATPIPPSPHETVVFCDDETPSYPVGYFRSAASTFANWSDGLVRENTSGASVYVQWIKDNSYSDNANYLSFSVPPIGPKPLPPTPLATAPVLERDQQTKVASETGQMEQAYNDELTKWQAAVDTASNYVKQQTDKIRNIPHNTSAPSDIWGCPQRATERFSEEPGDIKYLIVASDMDMVGPQEKATVQLTGVAVIVIDLETSDIGTYNARTAYWSDHLKQAGASSVTFYRPGDLLPTQAI